MKICDCTFPMVFSFLRKQLSGFLKSLPRVPQRFIAFGRGKRVSVRNPFLFNSPLKLDQNTKQIVTISYNGTEKPQTLLYYPNSGNSWYKQKGRQFPSLPSWTSLGTMGFQNNFRVINISWNYTYLCIVFLVD